MSTANAPSLTAESDRRRARRVLLVLGTAVLIAIAPFISGLLGAAVLYVLSAPAYRRAARVLPRRVAAATTAILVLVILLVPAVWLGWTATSEATALARGWRSSDALARLIELRIGGVPVAEHVASLVTTLLSFVSGRAMALVGSTVRATLNVVIALFGLYYLYLSAGELWRRARRHLPVPEDVAELLRARFVDVTEALLLGTLLTAILQGTLVGIGFRLVGLRAPVLWGLVTACVSVLPIMGSAFVWLPGVIMLVVDHRYGAATILGIIGAGAASNLDNVVRLIVFRRVSNIHPMLTLVGAFAGVALMGILGALLGPLVLTYFFELLRIYDQELDARA